MLKIKELIKSFIETQNKINANLEGLREDLKPKWDSIKTTGDMLNTCITTSTLDSYIENNIYTKEQTLETINKEYDYRKEYEKCLKENEGLLRMIETYCKYENKYDVLKIFEVIGENYDVRRKTLKKTSGE